MGFTPSAIDENGERRPPMSRSAAFPAAVDAALRFPCHNQPKFAQAARLRAACLVCAADACRRFLLFAVFSVYSVMRKFYSVPFIFRIFISAVLLAAAFAAALPQAKAQGLLRGGESRSLKIYFVHTNERAEVVFKKNGRYIRSGLQKLDYLTRDWRRNEAAHMDPRLFDLIWQIYQLSGSQDYIHVVSGYRSPQTNAMLRLASPASGVAKHSRHMEGKAMDFYLPDVNLAYLRAIALKLQGGGIGYYPNSGSPFVHVDVGSVRHWPRMSAPSLAALFPDGKSLHVPANGRALPAYAAALNAYRQRGALPLPVFSARQLFSGLSRRQVILAAADGKLPHLLGSRAADMRGLSGAGEGPAAKEMPREAPPPLMAEAELPLFTALGNNVPIPVAAPHLAAEQNEAAEDEADAAAAPVPVPQFKETAIKQALMAQYQAAAGGAARHDEIGALLAYAPMPNMENAAAGALSALTEAVPVPAAKPNAAAAGKSAAPALSALAAPAAEAAFAAPVPQLKPQPGSALPAENAAVPVPRFKAGRLGAPRR